MRPRAWTIHKYYLKRNVFYLQLFPHKHLVETGHRNSYLLPAVLISPALSFLNPLLSALLPLCFTPASHCCASQQMSTGWGSSSLALHTLTDCHFVKYVSHSVSSLLYFNNVFCLFQIIPWVFALMLKTKGRCTDVRPQILLWNARLRCNHSLPLNGQWLLNIDTWWLNCCFILLMQ